jgi:hypothetical protein
MEYNVTGFPKEEFLRLWDLVLIAREGINIPLFQRHPTLYRVSDRLEDFCETDRPAISNDEFVGLYYHDGQIWMKAGAPFRDMQDTALHEIAHHEVPHECHGPTWRKVFGTSFALYLRECGYGWDEIRHVVYSGVVAPYRVFRKISDPAEQRRIIRKESQAIVRHAKSRIPVLQQRSRTCLGFSSPPSELSTAWQRRSPVRAAAGR